MRTLLVFALGLGVAGCAPEIVEPEIPNAYVRLLNFSISPTQLDWQGGPENEVWDLSRTGLDLVLDPGSSVGLTEQTVFENIQYGTVTDYVEIDAGTWSTLLFADSPKDQNSNEETGQLNVAASIPGSGRFDGEYLQNRCYDIIAVGIDPLGAENANSSARQVQVYISRYVNRAGTLNGQAGFRMLYGVPDFDSYDQWCSVLSLSQDPDAVMGERCPADRPDGVAIPPAGENFRVHTRYNDGAGAFQGLPATAGNGQTANAYIEDIDMAPGGVPEFFFYTTAAGADELTQADVEAVAGPVLWQHMAVDQSGNPVTFEADKQYTVIWTGFHDPAGVSMLPEQDINSMPTARVLALEDPVPTQCATN